MQSCHCAILHFAFCDCVLYSRFGQSSPGGDTWPESADYCSSRIAKVCLGDFQTLADLDTYETVHSKDEKARNSKVQTGLLACAFWHFLFAFDLASGFELDLQRSFWLSKQIYGYISGTLYLTFCCPHKVFGYQVFEGSWCKGGQKPGWKQRPEGSDAGKSLSHIQQVDIRISQERAGSSAAFSSRRWEWWMLCSEVWELLLWSVVQLQPLWLCVQVVVHWRFHHSGD